MKTVWVFLCLLQICLVQSVVENTGDIVHKCKVEVDASNDDIKMILESKMPTSYSGLCLLACLYENAGIIIDGKFVIENLIKSVDNGAVAIGGQLAKQHINQIDRNCKDTENDDKCILARDIIMCVAESITRSMNLNKEL